jgi:predicted pyridoxine 5'-phosphate oxidase superfamily flavin-nucleotide-binding protein
MVTIPKHVQEFLQGKLAWVATAASDGTPNATPKGSVRLLDDQHIVFADLFSIKTRQNLEHNPKVAVTVIDTATNAGYQLKGTAELLSSGDLFEQTVEELKQKSSALPAPTYVVKISVEAIYDQSVGPNAGKQIA